MPPRRRYRGLLIGNAHFTDDPHGLPTLNGSLADIRMLSKALTDDEVGLFDPNDLRVLDDRGVQELRERLDEFFSAAYREDVLLLYYSGHGQLDLNNRLYLCARDTRTNSLRSTALKAEDINDMVTACAATSTVIMLDCCHSGAFKSADIFRGIAGSAGRGRYVLTSSRSTQLTRDTTEAGQLSPFTAQLVRGLRDAEADGYLTVTELYRQVHSWVAEVGGPVPQLRFSGEGEIVIARRDSRTLPAARVSPPLPEPDPALQPHPVWTAHRVRTGGVDRILEVTDGTRRHTVEYRSLPHQRAEVFLDRRRVHEDANQFTLDFDLGKDGAEARLEVTESDFTLSVDGRQVYGLRQAFPGSPDYREELAAAIRATLLADTSNSYRLGIAPTIPRWHLRSVQAKTAPSGRVTSSSPVIAVFGVQRTGPQHTKERVWFTDRAVHLRTTSAYATVPYEELAAATVDSSANSLEIAGTTIEFRSATGVDELAELINRVKNVVVYQDSGLGDTPPVNQFSGHHDDPEGSMSFGAGLALASFATFQGAVAFLLGHQRNFSAVYGNLGLGVFGVMVLFPLAALGPLATFCGIRPTFARAMVFTAVNTSACSTLLTWLPALLHGARDPIPLVGWTIRISDSLTLAIGGVDTGALGQAPRIWGATLLATVVYLAVVITTIWTRRQRQRRRQAFPDAGGICSP